MQGNHQGERIPGWKITQLTIILFIAWQCYLQDISIYRVGFPPIVFQQNNFEASACGPGSILSPGMTWDTNKSLTNHTGFTISPYQQKVKCQSQNWHCWSVMTVMFLTYLHKLKRLALEMFRKSSTWSHQQALPFLLARMPIRRRSLAWVSGTKTRFPKGLSPNEPVALIVAWQRMAEISVFFHDGYSKNIKQLKIIWINLV